VIDTTLAAAIRRHQSGDLQGAERLYREILIRQPRDPDALHLLGVLARQRGQVAEAVELITRALAESPNHAVAHYNLALALEAAAQTDQAMCHYRRAVALAPGLAEAWQNLGALLERRDCLQEAQTCFERVWGLRGDSADAACNLAHVLQRSGEHHRAIDLLHRAIELQPSWSRTYNQLGLCLREMGRLGEAEQAFLKLLGLDPNSAAGWTNLGRTLQDLQRPIEAIRAYQRALAIAPGCYETLVNLGATYKDVERYDEAASALQTAIGLAPHRCEAWHNLGKTLEEQGNLPQALTHYERALELAPDHPEIRLNRALMLLQTGDFAQGWDEYEWRWRVKDAPPRPDFPLPTWDGSPLAGKAILVFGEQGVGDEIMFASCYPDLMRAGARATLVCEPRLAPLFQRSFAGARILPATRGRENGSAPIFPDLDYAIAAGSLPRFLRRRLDEFPRRDRFLLPDEIGQDHWRARLAALGAGLKVGISWRAGTLPKNRRHRSTSLRDWSPLLTLPGARFVNLQYGDSSRERAAIDASSLGPIHHFEDVDPLHDLDGYAALVAALDLVISVGNATVHLAGALGTPCWALLPYTWGWRWLIGRHDTPWYPSVRLFRQSTHGDWPGLFETVAGELRGLVDAFYKPHHPIVPIAPIRQAATPHPVANRSITA
jgi:tetratricopeptide (TPR) repeat protein